MTERNEILGQLPKYILLNVMGMIGISCYILADTFFVSAGLGADGLAALNLALPVYSFVHGSGLMLGVGGAAKYSVSVSRGKKADGDAVFSNTLMAAAGLAAIYVALGLLLSEEIALLLGAGGEVFQMTETYLKTILVFAPLFMAGDVLTCFVRNDGSPGLSMAAMIGASLSNILLDYIFIFPLGMGIFGAALATGMAPAISMAILSLHMRKGERVRAVRTPFDARLVGKVAGMGVPSLITEVASGIVLIVFNGLILSLEGNIGVAAYGVVANISLVAVAVCTGIAQGMQPLASRVCGMGDDKAAAGVFKRTAAICAAVTLVIYAAAVALAQPAVSVFNSEGNGLMAAVAEEGMKIYFIMLPFAGFNIVTAMFFSAIEKPLPAQMISIARGFIIVIPAALLMTKAAGLLGLWLALPVTEGLTSLMCLWLCLRRRHLRLGPEAG